MRKNSGYLWVFTVIILLVASGCVFATPDNTNKIPAPHTILDNPCHLPCWYNIVPGDTTITEAENILYKIDFVDVRSVDKKYQEESFRTTISWIAVHPYDIHGKVLGEEGIVKRLRIEGKFGISLDDIFDNYGPPSAYTANFTIPATVTQWEYLLFYPENGAVFGAYQKAPMSKKEGLIYAEAQVWSVSLLDAFTLEAMITRMFGAYPPPWRLYRWHGFDPLPTPTVVRGN